MGWFADRLETLAKSQEKYAILHQGAFNTWMDKQPQATAKIQGMAGIAFLIIFPAIAILGAWTKADEAYLLFRGVRATATVRSFQIQDDIKRSGSKHYDIKVDYDFIVAGKRYQGGRWRNDLIEPVQYRPGDPLPITYNPSDPTLSTLEFHLALDVYAWLLFMAVIAVVPGLFGFFLWTRHRNWSRMRRAST